MKRLFLFLLVVIVIMSATICNADILNNRDLEDYGKAFQKEGYNLHPISGWSKLVGNTYIVQMDCLNDNRNHVLVEMTLIKGKWATKMYPPQRRGGGYQEKQPVEQLEKPKTVGHFSGLINHKTKVKITYNIKSGNGTASYDGGKVKHPVYVFLKQVGDGDSILINEYSGEEKKLIAKFEGANAGTGLCQQFNYYSNNVYYGIWSTSDGTEKYRFVLVYEESMLKPEDIPKKIVERGGSIPPESPDSYEQVEETPGQKTLYSYFNGLINHQTKVYIAYNIKSGSWTASYDDGKIKHPVEVKLHQENMLINEYSDIDKKLIATYKGGTDPADASKYDYKTYFGIWSTTDGTKENPFVLIGDFSKIKPEDIPKEFVQEQFNRQREWRIKSRNK